MANSRPQPPTLNGGFAVSVLLVLFGSGVPQKVSSSVFEVAQFDYSPRRGPSTWWFFHPEQCDDLLFPVQSPIELISSPFGRHDVLKNDPLEFRDAQASPTGLELFNDGTTVVMRPNFPEHQVPTLMGGPLIPFQEFRFDHMIWHWGENNSIGSEHIINGVRSPLELQLVFVNGLFSSFEEAIQLENGVVMLAVLFDIDPEMENSKLKLYEKVLRSLRKPGNRIKIEASGLPSLQDLIASASFEEYFSYHGSLTRPPCSNTVTWIVIKDQLKIHPRQVESFRALKGLNGKFIKNNWRPIQPRNQRTVVLKLSQI